MNIHCAACLLWFLPPVHARPHIGLTLAACCAPQCSNFAEGVAQSMGANVKTSKDGFALHRRSNQSSDWQPLLWAAKVNHQPLATQLIAMGRDINYQEPETGGHTKFCALHYAAHKGHEEMVDLLIERGAKLDLRDKMGKTPKDLAEKKAEPAYKRIVDKLEAAEMKGKKR